MILLTRPASEPELRSELLRVKVDDVLLQRLNEREVREGERAFLVAVPPDQSAPVSLHMRTQAFGEGRLPDARFSDDHREAAVAGHRLGEGGLQP